MRLDLAANDVAQSDFQGLLRVGGCPEGLEIRSREGTRGHPKTVPPTTDGLNGVNGVGHPNPPRVGAPDPEEVPPPLRPGTGFGSGSAMGSHPRLDPQPYEKGLGGEYWGRFVICLGDLGTVLGGLGAV